MDELLPPEVPFSPDPPPIPAAIPSSSAAPPPSPPLPPPTEIILPTSAPIASTSNLAGAPGLATKRQRRPSVRLGEIGDQSYDQSQPRRPKTWRFHKHPSAVAKTSKTRPLTNLVNGNGGGISYHHDYGSYEFGAKKSKSKRPTKRARSNSSWTSAAAIKFDADDDEFRERDEAAPAEEEEEEEEDGSQSPVHSMGIEFWDRRAMRGSNVDTTANGAIHNETNADDENIGVRDWLIGLGLGRYAPVFEVHEVDDQVLPMLTLDDLKDMGINAVGSRRKIYSAIQKLRQGFS